MIFLFILFPNRKRKEWECRRPLSFFHSLSLWPRLAIDIYFWYNTNIFDLVVRFSLFMTSSAPILQIVNLQWMYSNRCDVIRFQSFYSILMVIHAHKIRDKHHINCCCPEAQKSRKTHTCVLCVLLQLKNLLLRESN